MNPEQQNRWRFEVVNHVLLALAASRELRNRLVFKGALVLNRRLGTPRVSLDVDANLDAAYAGECPGRAEQRAFLEEQVGRAISRYFESQDPVRFGLERLRIDLSPQEDHPRGWNAFLIRLSLADHKQPAVRGLPSVTIDIAAPEGLSERSVADLDLDGVIVRAYTLERMAGEKARAFLTSLPAYRAKMRRPGEAVRVKDLYDLVRILRARPISDEGFWRSAGQEFRLACESRCVDCLGAESFKEEWAGTRAQFAASGILPGDCTVEDAEEMLAAMGCFWQRNGVLPLGLPAAPMSGA